MNGYFLVLVFVVLNIRAYVLMALDKRRAQQDKWRISERKLLETAFLFGFFGIWMGLLPPIRHKSSKLAFIFPLGIVSMISFAILYYANQYFGHFILWETPRILLSKPQ